MKLGTIKLSPYSRQIPNLCTLDKSEFHKYFPGPFLCTMDAEEKGGGEGRRKEGREKNDKNPCLQKLQSSKWHLLLPTHPALILGVTEILAHTEKHKEN